MEQKIYSLHHTLFCFFRIFHSFYDNLKNKNTYRKPSRRFDGQTQQWRKNDVIINWNITIIFYRQKQVTPLVAPEIDGKILEVNTVLGISWAYFLRDKKYETDTS